VGGGGVVVEGAYVVILIVCMCVCVCVCVVCGMFRTANRQRVLLSLHSACMDCEFW